jgi:hypothetical protein
MKDMCYLTVQCIENCNCSYTMTLATISCKRHDLKCKIKNNAGINGKNKVVWTR